MYCSNCGTKNADNAKFCNNCGSRMGGGPVRQNAPVQNNNTGKKNGFFSRFLVGLVAFSIFYGGSYVLTSIGNADREESNKNTNGVITRVTTPPIVETPAPVLPETGYIADLGGFWEQVNLKDGSFSLNVSALTFSQTVYNCTGFTVNMDVSMNSGTSCKDWQVWGRSGNKFVKLAKIYLPAGDGYTSQSVTFATPVTFDSIAITPTIVGSYSWSMSLSITDVWTD